MCVAETGGELAPGERAIDCLIDHWPPLEPSRLEHSAMRRGPILSRVFFGCNLLSKVNTAR